jgi:hypothetical protein
MNMKDLLQMVNEIVGESKCPLANDHCFKLATMVMQRQREDDALIAESVNKDAGQAIRNS